MDAELQNTRTKSHTCDGAPNGFRILRFPDVVNRTGLSKSTIYQRIRRDEFPAPVSLGVRAVGFVESEVDRWLAALLRQSTPKRQLDSFQNTQQQM